MGSARNMHRGRNGFYITWESEVRMDRVSAVAPIPHAITLNCFPDYFQSNVTLWLFAFLLSVILVDIWYDNLFREICFTFYVINFYFESKCMVVHPRRLILDWNKGSSLSFCSVFQKHQKWEKLSFCLTNKILGAPGKSVQNRSKKTNFVKIFSFAVRKTRL